MIQNKRSLLNLFDFMTVNLIQKKLTFIDRYRSNIPNVGNVSIESREQFNGFGNELDQLKVRNEKSYVHASTTKNIGNDFLMFSRNIISHCQMTY